MLKYSLLIVGFLCSHLSYAASFDCKKASLPIELLICSDEVLSQKDTLLGDTYKSLITETVNKQTLIYSQQQWLVTRNQCTTTDCVSRSYTKRLVQLSQMPRQGWQEYTDNALGISFYYPNGYQVKPCDEASGQQCLAIVDKSEKMTNSDYVIAFNIVTGGLEQNASEAGFQHTEGKWVTTFGRFSPVDAEKFSANNWQGIKAVITCGISDKETGFHAAGGECFWAVMSNGKHSVIANTQGIVGNDPYTFHIIETLKFL